MNSADMDRAKSAAADSSDNTANALNRKGGKRTLPHSLDDGKTPTKLSAVSKAALGGAARAVGEGAILPDRTQLLKKYAESLSVSQQNRRKGLASKSGSKGKGEPVTADHDPAEDIRALRGSDPRVLLISLSENGQFAAAVKAVYERSWTHSFRTYLDMQIAAKEQEIRETCRNCYGEFIEAVDSLLTLGSDATSLRKQVTALADQIANSTSNLISGARELSAARSIRENLAVTRLLFLRIQSLLDSLVRAEKLVNEKQHYAGLRALRLLQTNYSALLSELPQLARHVRQRADALTAKAFAHAESELEKWFTQAGLTSPQVGERVLKMHVQSLLAQEARAMQARRARAARMMFFLGSSRGLDDGEDDQGDEEGSAPDEASPSSSSSKHKKESSKSPPSRKSNLERTSLVGLYLGSYGAVLPEFDSSASGPNASPSSSSTGSVPSAASATAGATPGAPIVAASVSELLVALSEGSDGIADGKGLSSDALPSTQAPTTTAASVAAAGEGSAVDADFGLATLYQCSNTFRDRGADAIFRNRFAARRLHTLAALLHLPPVDEVLPYLRVLETRLSAILGFVVLEARIAASATELSTLTELEAVWERACSRLSEILCRQALATFRLPSHFIAFKQLLSAFASAISACHLPAQPIGMILRSQVFRRFEEVLEGRFVSDFATVLATDRFEQMEIKDPKEYQSVVLANGLKDQSDHVESYPTKLPFSSMVPGICKALRSLIASHHRYTSFLPFPVPPDAVLELALVRIMGQIVPQKLTGLIQRASNVAHVAQLALNAAALADSTQFLRSYLLSFVDSEGDGASRAPASSPSASKDGISLAGQPNSDSAALIHAHVDAVRDKLVNLRAVCEDALYESIRSKIDDFLGMLTHLDWLPSAGAPGPSDPIVDLIGYLETTLMCLLHLPDAIREAVQFTMCKHIATVYMLTLHVHVKKFNQIAIANMELDVNALEEFAARCNLPNLPDSFAEMRQLTQLLLGNDLNAYADPATRARQFPYLNLGKMIRLLDKFKDIGLLARMPRGIPTFKRKDIDTLLTKLKREEKESG